MGSSRFLNSLPPAPRALGVHFCPEQTRPRPAPRHTPCQLRLLVRLLLRLLVGREVSDTRTRPAPVQQHHRTTPDPVQPCRLLRLLPRLGDEPENPSFQPIPMQRPLERLQVGSHTLDGPGYRPRLSSPPARRAATCRGVLAALPSPDLGSGMHVGPRGATALAARTAGHGTEESSRSVDESVDSVGRAVSLVSIGRHEAHLALESGM